MNNLVSKSGRVSILINNYNYEKYLREAIDSALAQKYPDIEVIVVDDGSTDCSRNVIQSYGERVRAVYQANGGQSKAFNSGFEASTGEFIFFLDADDIFLQDKVHQVVKIFEQEPEIGFVFHAVEKFNSSSGLVEGRTPLQFEGIVNEKRSLRHRGKPKIFLPPTSAFCFRRDCLNKIFPMPESSGIGISDKYLGILALSISSGYYSNKMYARLRLHGSNLYSGEGKNYSKIYSIGLETAVRIFERDQTLWKYSVKLLARAEATRMAHFLSEDGHTCGKSDFLKKLIRYRKFYYYCYIFPLYLKRKLQFF